MRNGLLPIGAFARAAALSVITLRHYHDTGLLAPAHVDPDTGYRYYSAAQLVDAEVIRRLRALDLPLEEVRTVLAARDEQVTADVVATHKQRMADRLAETERIVRELQALTTAPLRLLAERVEERSLPAWDVLAMSDTVSEKTIGDFMESAYAALAQAATDHALTLTGPAGALYPGAEWDPQAVAITAFLPVSGPARPPQWRQLPGGRFAVALHAGSYESIADTYRSIGVWLANDACDPALDIRESYLVGPGDDPDPTCWRTEIAWPLGRSDTQPVTRPSTRRTT